MLKWGGEYIACNVIHQTKPEYVGIHHAKGLKDRSTYKGDNRHLKRSTNFWTPCMYETWIKIRNRMQIDEKECRKKYSTLLNTDQQNFASEISYLSKTFPGKLYEPPLAVYHLLSDQPPRTSLLSLSVSRTHAVRCDVLAVTVPCCVLGRSAQSMAMERMRHSCGP